MPTTISGSNGVTTPTGAVYNGIQSQTAVASTSGTSIDFTSIPSWVKRITVMFQGVSTSGTSAILVQIGSGSIVATGYVGGGQQIATTPTLTGMSTGFFVTQASAAANTYSGQMIISNSATNTWTETCIVGRNDGSVNLSGGYLALGGTLDRVRITTVNGTDTFDAGSINILYE